MNSHILWMWKTPRQRHNSDGHRKYNFPWWLIVRSTRPLVSWFEFFSSIFLSTVGIMMLHCDIRRSLTMSGCCYVWHCIGWQLFIPGMITHWISIKLWLIWIQFGIAILKSMHNIWQLSLLYRNASEESNRRSIHSLWIKGRIKRKQHQVITIRLFSTILNISLIESKLFNSEQRHSDLTIISENHGCSPMWFFSHDSLSKHERT
jgi:hypothetical protein